MSAQFDQFFTPHLTDNIGPNGFQAFVGAGLLIALAPPPVGCNCAWVWGARYSFSGIELPPAELFATSYFEPYVVVPNGQMLAAMYVNTFFGAGGFVQYFRGSVGSQV